MIILSETLTLVLILSCYAAVYIVALDPPKHPSHSHLSMKDHQ